MTNLFVDIEKRLGNFRLRVKFEAGNEVLALLGASGSGKSMTLKCIAGIEKPDKGKITLDGRVLFDSENHINLSPQKRRVGYLFQQYALFPNMTVEENIAAGVRDKRAVLNVVREAVSAMHLEGTEKRRPHQLSGGQQQRVALARILVNEPDVLLLDEPFSALDSHLRFQLEQELKSVIRQFGKTVLLVSHNRDEVFRLTDSIALMSDGKIETLGEKNYVFANPKTKNGAILTGCKNISAIEKLGDNRVFAKDWGIELCLDTDPGLASHVGIRMHDVLCEGEQNCFDCKVSEIIENSFSYVIMLSPFNAAGKNTELTPIGRELGKEDWQGSVSDVCKISMPPESLLLLE